MRLNWVIYTYIQKKAPFKDRINISSIEVSFGQVAYSSKQTKSIYNPFIGDYIDSTFTTKNNAMHIYFGGCTYFLDVLKGFGIGYGLNAFLPQKKLVAMPSVKFGYRWLIKEHFFIMPKIVTGLKFSLDLGDLENEEDAFPINFMLGGELKVGYTF